MSARADSWLAILGPVSVSREVFGGYREIYALAIFSSVVGLRWKQSGLYMESLRDSCNA